jgi:transposase
MATRIRIVLMLDEGTSYQEIQEKLDTTAPTISLRKKRYRQEGIVGLATCHPGQPPQKLTTQLRARILAKTQQRRRTGPRTGRPEKWAVVMQIGKDLVRQVWKQADLKPQRLDRYMASDDPHFGQKATEIIGPADGGGST